MSSFSAAASSRVAALWAQPGGFLEVDETVTEGAVRETLEETGLIVEPGDVIGLYARLEAAVIVLAYEARIVGGTATTGPEALEIQTFAPEAIPWAGIAFRTTWWALVDWLARRRPDLTPPTRRWDDNLGEPEAPAPRRQRRSMKMFFVSVYRSIAAMPSSRPTPDIL